MFRFLRALYRFFRPCRHETTYRDRRNVLGVSLPHYVCMECGHAELIIKREGDLVTFTEPAHERMKARVKPSQPARVLPIGRAKP